MKNNIINRINKFFQNIDLRKFFGTIVGGIFFLCCVAYFTYAYYEWKSDETSIALTIHESEVKCTLGPNVTVSNIGPVLKISDGVKTSFGIENTFTEDMAVSVTLDITSISEELLDESFKWAIVEDQEGGENFDYENSIIEGSFKNFRVGNNLITTALPVTTQNTTNYQFIVYIDGTMKNDISMMQNSMEASLSLGNCGEDYIPYDELTQFAFYSADDNSLTFTYDYPVAVGDIYQGKTVTNLYTGYDTTAYNSESTVPWYSDGNYDDITSVTFLSTTTPTSTAYWFSSFKNVENMNLEKLDTSNVTTMREMFNNCSKLEVLNVDNFNTSNVTDMFSMFEECRSLIKLDLSNFDTSNVTVMNDPGNYSSGGMFRNCNNLKYLDVSSFDTSKVKLFSNMFNGCNSLAELDVSGWNTSNATEMGGMFANCFNLSVLDVSNFDTRNVIEFSEFYGGMFGNCNSLTNLDLSGWNTSNVTRISFMFSGCTSLINLDLSGWNTSNVADMNSMFDSCKSLTNLDLSSFDTSNVTGMSSMFGNCNSLTNLDLSSFDTSNVTNMHRMFAGCSSLINLDLSGWNTSNVTKMSSMFHACTSLINLDLSDFDIINVTDIDRMFYDCRNMVELKLSEINSSVMNDISEMFYGCRKIVTSLIIMNFDMTSGLNYSGMFSNSANAEGAAITVYYVGDNPTTTNINESTYDLVESMIAAKPTNSNIINGGCYGEFCSSTNDTNEEGTV